MIMMKMMEKVSDDGHNVGEPWRFRSSWSWRTLFLPPQAFPDINTMAIFPDINTMAMFPDINTMAMSSIMMMKPKEYPHHSKEGARWIIHQIERDNSNLLLDKKLPLCVNLAECPRPCPPPLATSSS